MRKSDVGDGEPADQRTTWHLCWQAAIGREFFTDETLYERVQERLIDAHQRRGRELAFYLLLPTEIHVLSIIPSGDSASSVARAIGNVVARWVRRSQPITSPILAAPFRAHRIASVQELRDDVRMLSWRPVLQGVRATPQHHPHGALRFALGLRSRPIGYSAGAVLSVFGPTVTEARLALHAWIAKRPSDRDAREWELARGLRLAASSSSPQRSVALDVRGSAAAALVALGGAAGIDGALDLLERWVALRLGAADPVAGVAVSDQRSARCRGLVACLAVKHRLCSAASVARHFGRAKATLSEQMAACRKRPTDQALVATPVEVILAEVAAMTGSGR